jgi:serine phosphatase RsbU (regulator of sigma subunit)
MANEIAGAIATELKDNWENKQENDDITLVVLRRS